MIEIIAKDNDIIPYRKELNAITGGITATILLQQIIYRFVNNGNKAFYKFIEPCNHEKYTEGDSWCEELGFTRKEFLTAIKKLEDAGLVSKKTNMQRLTYYTLNQGDLDKALKGIYINTKRGFTKMPKGDLDNKETENTTENTTNIKEKNKKENSSLDLQEIVSDLETEYFDNAIEMKYPLNEKKYLDFIQFRKELKKPITKTAAKEHIQLLCKYPVDIQEEMIKQSISSNWQGLFILKIANKQQSSFTQPKSKVQKTNEYIDDFFERMAEQGKESAIDVEVLS